MTIENLEAGDGSKVSTSDQLGWEIEKETSYPLINKKSARFHIWTYVRTWYLTLKTGYIFQVETDSLRTVPGTVRIEKSFN